MLLCGSPFTSKERTCIGSSNQSREAITDYDRVLELDPENANAYANRAIAKMDIGQYLAASVDFGEAIGRKNDYTLESLYDRRGDAYMKLGMHREAIESYSKAITRYLAI